MAGAEAGDLMHPNTSEMLSGSPFLFGNEGSSSSPLEVPKRSQEDK